MPKAKFKKMDRNYKFSWQDLGDAGTGRPHLGLQVPVLVYRLMHYTLRDTLDAELGKDAADAIFTEAGRQAGFHFCKNMLDLQMDFNEFIAQLQRILKEHAIGILRIESVDLESMHFVLTLSEDLDCSGLPCTDEVACKYDEGFIAGLLEAYTGKSFSAKEIDCWASGDRVCRFDVRADQANQ
jgi:predicted hydrocarbon binding protein